MSDVKAMSREALAARLAVQGKPSNISCEAANRLRRDGTRIAELERERDELQATLARVRKYEGDLRLRYNNRENPNDYHDHVLMDVADELEDALADADGKEGA